MRVVPRLRVSHLHFFDISLFLALSHGRRVLMPSQVTSHPSNKSLFFHCIVYWIHPDTRDVHIMSNPFVMNGASFPLNSYVGHEFEVRELPSEATGECKSEDQTCRSTYFVVSENNAQSKCNLFKCCFIIYGCFVWKKALSRSHCLLSSYSLSHAL